MYFSTGFIVSLFAASGLVSAAPLQSRKAEIKSLTSTRLDSSGAVYCECGFVLVSFLLSMCDFQS